MFLINQLTNYLWDFFTFVGLANKRGTVLFLGLDNAGKTTLMRYMVDGRVQILNPTLHQTSNTVKIKNLELTIHDVGGHTQARRIWHTYVFGVSAVVYIIDIFDQERWPESREALNTLLQMEEIRNVPIAILANKVDIPNSPSIDQLIDEFGLRPHLNDGREENKRALSVFPASVWREQGIQEGFTWLGNMF